MGKRKIVIKQSVAERIAEIAWYIESKGMLATAEKFSDSVYDFFEYLSDDRKSYRLCKEPVRASLGLKCISFSKNIRLFLLKQLLKLPFVSSCLLS